MTAERKAALDRHLELAGKYFNLKFSEAMFARAILQVAYMAIRLYSTNTLINTMPMPVGRRKKARKRDTWEDATRKATRLTRISKFDINRVGGGLAAPVLPHHRTYLRIRRFPLLIQLGIPCRQGDQLLFPEPFHGHGFSSLGAASHSPPSLARSGQYPGAPFRHP